MLETDENVNEETPAEDAAEAPDQVAEEVVAPEEPAEEPTADEVAEESAQAEEAPADDAPAAEAPAAPAPAEDAEPAEVLGPKERRRRARSAHTGEARPTRTIEERAAERAERRATKAKQRSAYRQKQRERRGSETHDQTPQAAVEQTDSGSPKLRQGVVVSDKADKTITVRIDTARAHRMYKKIVRSSSTLHAHDEQNEAHIGDTVRLVESRPLSRTKRWRLIEVLERAK
jgi:small subunit ribosomal protein S17